MSKLFGKRFHRIPIALASVLLAVVLVAGGAFATFAFWPATATVAVEEAMVVSCFDTWDNLHPYGSDIGAVWKDTPTDGEHTHGTGELGDVAIALGDPTIAITTISGYAGAGFVAGEWIVIPVNFRNAGDGTLILGATAVSDPLVVDCCWLTNDGTVTETHPDGDLAYGFKDDDSWVTLDGWEGIIGPKGGESGSARLGAQVLFVRISAPGDIVPTEGTPYTITITFNRS